MPNKTKTLLTLVERMANWSGLDGVSQAVADAAGKATDAKPVKNALSGSWMGHPIHPLVVHGPIGAWGAAAFLDLTGSDDDAARRLVGAGVLAAVPAALTGASDWSTLHEEKQRLGFVHAAANGAATTLQATSWVVRARGHRKSGVTLSMAAMGLTAAGGYLGGHLSYSHGVGVNRTAFEATGEDWVDVAAQHDLSDGSLTKVTADGVDVVLINRGGSITALSNVCTHAGAPLDEGSLENGCVVCPWHGSEFHATDGAVERGPASVPQPVWKVKVTDGRVLVRRAQ